MLEKYRRVVAESQGATGEEEEEEESLNGVPVLAGLEGGHTNGVDQIGGGYFAAKKNNSKDDLSRNG